jgi:deoxyribodipyrimidine photo-lyase
MQQSQRAEWNHALEYAVLRANERNLPVLAAFGLTDDYPEANARHYVFMLEGLRETRDALVRRGIAFTVRRGQPAAVALELAQDAALVVCDRGYLHHQKAWRSRVAREAARSVVQVEGDAVVPVDIASGKAEYAARTIRPRIHRHLDEFLVAPRSIRPLRPWTGRWPHGVELDDVGALLADLAVDRRVPPVTHAFRGGTTHATNRLRRFLRALPGYAEGRAHPEAGHVSQLSPYLHFGQISPLRIALTVKRARAPAADRAAFLEELIVRRELALNFVERTPRYDRYDALPGWARATLAKHRADPRAHRYSAPELEAAATHDPWWNAAMREAKYTGYMHNHMRMYWGKKILEWCATPEYAYRVAITLNNRWFLDGRDPSSWANVAWLFGLHDRPWGERAVYGSVRSMSAAGLERKHDMAAYARRVERQVAAARRAGVMLDGD